MKLPDTHLEKTLHTGLDWITRYSVTCFLMIFALLVGYIVVSVGTFSVAEPTQLQVDDTMSKNKDVHVDSGALKIVRTLKERDSSVSASFNSNRTNPFEDQ